VTARSLCPTCSPMRTQGTPLRCKSEIFRWRRSCGDQSEIPSALHAFAIEVRSSRTGAAGLVGRDRGHDYEHGHRDRKHQSYRVYSSFVTHSSHVRCSSFVSSRDRRSLPQSNSRTGQTVTGMRPSPEMRRSGTRGLARSNGREFQTIGEGNAWPGRYWASSFPSPPGGAIG
jgi:hypothetical protein